MLLSHLIKSPRDIDIRGITADSRQVRPGFLFVALRGSKSDGGMYVNDAIMHGAVAIVGEAGTEVPEDGNTILIIVDNARLALARIAAKFYEKQPGVIAAVTGTSGKTSIVTFTKQLWHLLGITQSASLGTLGMNAPGIVKSGSLTTPDTVSLHAMLSDLAGAGVTHVAMEASSHGLDQHRLDGVRVNIAAFTNLSRDHMDYHKTIEEYFTAKARLFDDVLIDGGTAVLNADDEYFGVMKRLSLDHDHAIISYGVDEKADIRLVKRTLQPVGQEVTLSVFGTEYTVTIPLVGEFQIYNALCALGTVIAGGAEATTAVPLLSQLQGVKGRLQLVTGHPHGAAVYVDYAHKPAAIEAVLNALRPHTEGRLIIVLGCGGNRDTGKRPIMGRIATGLSDLVVVTDDNPRNENPRAIRAAIIEGAPDAHEIADRHDAVQWAVEDLRAGDVLVIAGKGHENGQTIGDRVHPFDDVEEAKKAIEKMKTGK